MKVSIKESPNLYICHYFSSVLKNWWKLESEKEVGHCKKYCIPEKAVEWIDQNMSPTKTKKRIKSIIQMQPFGLMKKKTNLKIT